MGKRQAGRLSLMDGGMVTLGRRENVDRVLMGNIA